jgi:hypothetical protein
MKQLNVNFTDEFERDLKFLMRKKKIHRKSDAVRQAVHEAAERIREQENFDFKSLIGIGLGGKPNPNPRFKTEDDLWS